jgi:hypothetical protein
VGGKREGLQLLKMPLRGAVTAHLGRLAAADSNGRLWPKAEVEIMLFQVICGSAPPPKAAAELISVPGAADDPKRTCGTKGVI